MQGNFRLPAGLYGITAEKFSLGRSNVEVAEAMIDAGVRVIQYREKRPAKSYREMLLECMEIRKRTRDAGVLFLVNDYVDIAMLTDADGVHVGQDDLPVEPVRRLLGAGKIIGVSTHSPAQARRAVADGADYIGVGPIFATSTKDDVCAPVGLTYLEHVVRELKIPFVAIGGIKRENLAAVVKQGAKTLCLVTEVVGAPDIRKRIREILEILDKEKSRSAVARSLSG